MTVPAALRLARVAEAVYAVLSAILAFGLPLPPRGPGMVLFAHWIGTAILAAAIALRLRRPNRQTWWVAAILAAYVLMNGLITVSRLVGPTVETLGRPGAPALIVGAVLWSTQIAVGWALYVARELRLQGARWLDRR